MKQAYKTYKDSGVEWIGKIPESWDAVKIKYLTDIYTGNSLNSDLKEKYQSENLEDLPYVSTKDIDIDNNSLDYDNGLRIPLDEGNYKVAPKGSFLLCVEGANAGKKLAYVEQDCYFVNKLACFTFPNKYLYYYSQSHPFKSQFFNSISGLIGGVATSVLKEFNSVLPSPQEQTQIAAYLDYHTGKINALISKKETLIQKLQEQRQAIINEAVTKGLNKNVELKDSGIEWLGEIPEHWEVLSFRYIIDVLTDFTANGSFGDLAKNVNYLEEGYSRLIRLTDLREEMKNKGVYVSEHSHNYLSKSTIIGDEVLLANVGAYSGLAWKVPNINYPATLGPNMFLLKFNKKLDNDFAYLSLISNYLFKQLEQQAISAAQPKLNKENVRSCYFILPNTLEEQKEIVSYLKLQLEKVENGVNKLNSSIQKLKEYRQSLISEAVTGKIDVRDWQQPEINQ